MRLTAALLGVGALACGGAEGDLTVLTYNVAGLPSGLSGSDPERNTPLISPLLNDFDLVLVQEDFGFHAELVADVTHRHRSVPKVAERAVNDGLNRFSVFPFDTLHRARWESCFGGIDSGSDCLSDKGFSVATTALSDQVAVDVYNLHMDAGGSDGDKAARSDQVDQLIAEMNRRSSGRAVIVAGDTNLHYDREHDESLFVRLLEDQALEDVCRAVSCGDERIDRVLFRGSDEVELAARAWSVPEQFVDASGADLSDHKPVSVELTWRRK